MKQQQYKKRFDFVFDLWIEKISGLCYTFFKIVKGISDHVSIS